MIFSASLIDEIQAEVSTTGRYINPSKIDGEIRVRFFGEGISGYEAWNTENRPERWETKPSELPGNIRKNEDGRDPLKRFIAATVWDYDTEEFKVLSLTQKTLISALMHLMTDEDWGDPLEYDIKISKKGEGMGTEYKLTPCPKKAVATKVMGAYDDLTCNLQAMFDGDDPFAKA